MSALDITLSHEETIELKRRVRSATIPQREGRRARIILLAAEGETRDNIARLTGFSCPTITLWCQRFQARRLDGLVDQPGRGRKSSLPEETVRRVLEQVTRPRIGEPRWSCRSMARAAGISSTTVHKLWAANDLKPHLTRTFKLSNDPQFDEKFWDVI
ncbi:IS630 family transposase, partial [Pseudomonas syringae pv. actinidiae]